MTLNQIAIKHGTDKATLHPVKGHGYCPHYSTLFERVRREPIKVLEIGVGGGESIRTWLDYFDKARIFGVDNVKDTNPWNSTSLKPDPRYTFVYGDQSCGVFWKCFEADYGSNWGIIIDDGGHYSNQIIKSYECLWPLVAPGGLYCIEDLGVAYGGSMFVPEGSPNHMDWLRSRMDQVNQTDDIEALHLFKELAIFRKPSSYSLAT